MGKPVNHRAGGLRCTAPPSRGRVEIRRRKPIDRVDQLTTEKVENNKKKEGTQGQN